MQNYSDTILSQYANSPTLSGIIEAFNGAIDPATISTDILQKVWDISTAAGFALDIWGRILGIGRSVAAPANADFFGYSSDAEVFGGEAFSPGSGATQYVPLGDEQYRRVLMIKALVNITDCSAANINRALAIMYGADGGAYVHDVGDMRLVYTLLFEPSPSDTYLFSTDGVFPRPAGVLQQFQSLPQPTFGFASDSEGFGLAPLGKGLSNVAI